MLNTRELKFEGKTIIRATMALWFKLTLSFVMFGIGLELLSAQLGGTLPLYIFSLESFPDTVTGFARIEDGFQFVLRMDLMGTVASFSITYSQILLLLVIQAILLIALSPFRMIILELLWKSFRSEEIEAGNRFRWYRKPSLMGKSIAVGAIVGLGGKLLSILLMLPSLIISFLIASGDMATYFGGDYAKVELMAGLGIALMVLGAFFAFYIHSVLDPIYYCLAAKPEYSLGKVISRGLASTKGYRKEFFILRMSFLPWYIVSRFSYGMVDMYALPYISFTSFCFLREVALEKES